MNRPIVLVTGSSRRQGIGSAIAIDLAKNGWDIVLTYWKKYDQTMPWGSDSGDIECTRNEIIQNGGRCYTIEGDLSDTETPNKLFTDIEDNFGLVSAIILSHCYSVDSSILLTTIESFNMHFDINTRASWLLIKEFALRFKYHNQPGRIIALTSDHTAHNLPYGASKGALDRIVIAAAEELHDKYITANVIDPGANDTGWMSDDFKELVKQKTYLSRVGTPTDTANLVSFLCSKSGEWINGQLIHSNGGVRW